MGADDGRPEGEEPRARKPARGGRTLALLAAIRESGLPPTQRWLLSCIAQRIGWTTKRGRPAGTCHPGTAKLAKDTGLSRSTVCALLPALAAAGWLQIEPRSEGGATVSNRYRVTPRR